MKENNLRTHTIKQLMEDDNQRKGRTTNIPEGGDIKDYSLQDKIPREKLHLQSKDLATTRLNLQIDNDKAFKKGKTLLSKEMELFKVKGYGSDAIAKNRDDNKIVIKGDESTFNRENLKEIFRQRDEELRKSMVPTQPKHSAYEPGDCYKLENDLNKHLMEIERIKVNMSQPQVYSNKDYTRFEKPLNELSASTKDINELQKAIDHI
jgi:hypothetical protein